MKDKRIIVVGVGLTTPIFKSEKLAEKLAEISNADVVVVNGTLVEKKDMSVEIMKHIKPVPIVPIDVEDYIEDYSPKNKSKFDWLKTKKRSKKR